MEKRDSRSETKEEILAAIERTQKEISAPSGLDIKDLLNRAVEVYWAERERQTPETEDSLLEETAAIARYVAARFRRPLFEIVSDAAAATLPLVFLLLATTAYVLLRADRALAARTIYLALGLSCAAAFLAVATAYLVGKVSTFVTKREFFAHSFGALLGGLFVGIAAIGYVSVDYRHNRESVQTTLALAQDRLERVAVFSMQNRLASGTFWKPATGSGPLRLTAQGVSSEQAIYEASAKTVPGMLVCRIGPTGGDLRWEYSHGSQLRARFVVGTVDEVYKNHFVLTVLGGKKIDVAQMGDGVVPPKGMQVIAVLEPERNVVRVIQPSRLFAAVGKEWRAEMFNQ